MLHRKCVSPWNGTMDSNLEPISYISYLIVSYLIISYIETFFLYIGGCRFRLINTSDRSPIYGFKELVCDIDIITALMKITEINKISETSHHKNKAFIRTANRFKFRDSCLPIHINEANFFDLSHSSLRSQFRKRSLLY